MAATFCPRTLQFCAARITRLDGAGVSQPGAGNMYITDQQIDWTIGVNNEKGADLTQKTGCDNIAYAFKARDQLKNLTLTSTFATCDPELEELLCGGDLIKVGGDTIGYAIPAIGSVGSPNGVCFEGWTKNIKGSFVDPIFPYVRWVAPRNFWTRAETKLENNPINHQFTGEGYENANIEDGPVGDFPLGDGAVAYSDRALFFFGDTSLPTAQCEAVAVIAS